MRQLIQQLLNRVSYLAVLSVTLVTLSTQTSYAQAKTESPKNNQKEIASKETVKNEPPEKKLSNTDPRQYINILYKRNAKSTQLDTIYKWENRPGLDNQKLHRLNSNGIIRIYFNKEELYKNTEFRGTLSLSANVTGTGGKREIEVESYSEVGKNRSSYGIESAPARDLAISLLNLIIHIGEVTEYDESKNFNDEIDNIRAFDKAIADLKIIQSQNNKKNQKSNYDTTYSDEERIASINNTLKIIDTSKNFPINNSRSNKAYSKNEKEEISDLIVYIIGRKETAITDLSRRINKLKIEYQNSFKQTLKYLEFFKHTGSHGKDAVFRIINQDTLSYEHLIDNIKRYQDTLSNTALDKSSNIDDLEKLKDVIVDGRDDLMEFITTNNKIFYATIKSVPRIIYDTNRNGDTNYIERWKYVNETYIKTKEPIIKRHPGFLSRKATAVAKYCKDNPREIIASIAKEIGRVIFSELDFATIDLAKNSVEPGDRLEIFLISKRNGNEKPNEIGKYRIANTGWQTSVSDMFALVERVDASFDKDSASISPSRFKGSGGVSFMFTYNKEYKPAEIKKIYIKNSAKSIIDSTYKATYKNKLFNFLEPSIGLNVSYLDFKKDRDVEIGTGIQLGLFRNKVFFGYGLNLHMLRPQDVSPSYFFLGFSFANLQTLFKDSKSINLLE